MMRLRTACLLLVVVAACARPSDRPNPTARFAEWRNTGNDPALIAYTDFLRHRQVADVLPLSQLLRTGRYWWRCGASEFAVPPQEHWPRIVPTLRLVRELQRERLLPDARAGSVYRDKALNWCEGGAPGSKHLSYNAIDFDLGTDADIQRLCAYWQSHGAPKHFGLGFYDARRIHVDTSGFRTWGKDFRSRSSRCRPANH